MPFDHLLSGRNTLIKAWTDKLLVNSKPIRVEPNERYRVACKITGIEGRPYSAYFGVFILGSEPKECIRFVRWINNFDGLERDYEIIFTTPSQAKSIVLGYRINTETLKNSNVEVRLQDLESIKLEKFNGSQADSFDRIPDHEMPILRPLTEREEDVLERNMVWIFGFQRSGTTWLGRDLLSYKTNRYWHEPKIALLLSIWNKARHQDEYIFSDIHKNNWIKQFRKFVLMRTYSQFPSLENIVIIKEPSPNLAANTVMECFPKSKLIFILRDGRDAIDSAIDSHLPGSWRSTDPVHRQQPLNDQEARLQAIHRYAEDWKINIMAIKEAFDNHDPKLRLLIKYENLRKNTYIELKKIYEFLEVELADDDIKGIIQKYAFEAIPEQERGSGKFYRSATPGGWRENFNEKEKELMESLIGPILKTLGYDSQN